MKILLVDDEAQVLRGVSRMIQCEAEDWDVETAMSGDEALALLEADVFDVVVSDMRMPDMDGAQLLEKVAARFPKILRVILSGQADRETVLRAIRPMHQYLAKPCEPQVLIDTIRRAEVLQETVSSAEILDAISRANCLPSLPTIVNEINEELASENSTAASLSRVISKDPILSAKILQLSNSALFGLQRPIVEVERGISLIGAEMIKSLAISLTLLSPKKNATTRSISNLFDHCLSVGGVSRQLAVWEGADSRVINTVFSGGLLHDIGKIVLLNSFEDRYRRLDSRAAITRTPIWELEMEEFGASHAGVGAYLLELWGVPSELIETVAAHHSLEICSRSSLACRIVFAANWIAHGGDASTIERATEPLEMNWELNEFVEELHQWNNKLKAKEEETSIV